MRTASAVTSRSPRHIHHLTRFISDLNNLPPAAEVGGRLAAPGQQIGRSAPGRPRFPCQFIPRGDSPRWYKILQSKTGEAPTKITAHRTRGVGLNRETKMKPGERRALVTWKALHDNGWVTAVVERPDHTFIAVAGPVGRHEVEDVRKTIEDARTAALSALNRSTGHTCSWPSCSEWELNVHSEH